ncbi:RHS repeat-associated core domain-containing protein, partial [Polyangium sp. 15x6]|uniref:RHS repeat-associated core domain-containing protein n=1 Tax=Polyangium sp. 15x6 TaxID=3042687 RepID=UPI002499FF26
GYCAAATNPPSARRRGEHARAAHVAPAMGADGRPDGGGRGLTVNGLPAATVATDVLGLAHSPMPPGAVFAPNDVPDNAGTLVTGSQSVYFAGLSAGRTGSLVSSCNYPVNAPTSSAIAVPAGPPVDVGGPDAFSAAAAIMRGARTKWTSNALHSAFRIGPRTRMSKFICTLTGHPVDVMTGEVLTDAVDFVLPGPLPLVFERNYYSNDETEGALGRGWSHSLEACVDEKRLREGDLSFDLRLPDGRVARHLALDVGAKEWRDQDRYWLSRDDDGYTLEFIAGIKYRFERVRGASATHPLVRIEDRNGNAIALRYRSGDLAEVTDSAGRELRFSMVGKRLGMIRVRRSGSGGDELHTLVRFTYHRDGYLATAEDAAARAVQYKYKGGVLVQETLRTGVSFHFVYDWYAPGGYCIHTWGEGPGIEGRIYERKLTYHKEQFATVVEDGRCGRTQYFGNGDGLVEREIDPMGVERRYEWNERFWKVAEIDGLGRRTEWSYDERGNVLCERDALGQETRFTYNKLALPVGRVDATGALWRSFYDDRGNRLRDVDPLGCERRFCYDRRGLCIEAHDELGRVTRFEFDAHGNAVSARTPGGGFTRREFDDLGRLVKLVDARGVEHRFDLDACGHVVRAERSDGAWMRMKRDADGNVIESEDEARRFWRYTYVGTGQLARQVDPEGGEVRLRYDGEEDLVAVTNEAGETHRIERDKAGRVVREVGFDGRVTECLRDRVGKTKRITTAAGKKLGIERDALDRIVRITMPGPIPPGDVLPSVEATEYAYDARGDIVRAKNAAIELHFVRDACGRVVEERAGDVVITSAFDAVGARVRVQTSLGHEAHFGFDRAGELELVSFGHDGRFGDFAETALRAGAASLRAPWKATIERDAHGDEIARRMPGGVTSAWGWDRVGRPAARAVVGSDVEIEQLYRWKTDTELAAVEVSEGQEISFGHDGRGYLIASTLPDGRTFHRPVDEVGNVYRSEDRSDRRYGAGGRIEVADGVQLVHDKAGNLAERVLPDGRRWRYEWNALDQLVAVVRPDGKRVTFAYDPFGRRVWKENGGTRTRYVWDGDDLVHELRDGAPVETWLWDPGGLCPSAKAVGAERFAVVADHRGAPLVLLDEKGDPAWHGGIDPFGAAHVEAARTTCPWRFAGQYADEETGLSYNRFRYYDPTLGQYISPDPIGLEGGLGQYAYVKEPWAFVDPLGLSCKKPKSAYSVAFEVRLPPSLWGRGHKKHIQAANRMLDDAVTVNPSLGQLLNNLIPDLSKSVSQAGGRSTPQGMVWHHVQAEAGVMHLVPLSQHTPGSQFWNALHPNGYGGYADWARIFGAPKR